MESTTNIGLHQWQSGDSFLRTDFNEDFSKIDEGIGKLREQGYVIGTYRATNNTSSPVTISVGFAPAAVLICKPGECLGERGVFIARGMSLVYGGKSFVEFTNTGFIINGISNSSGLVYPWLNHDGEYCYLAFR